MLLRRLIEIFVCFNNNVLAEMQGYVVEGEKVAIGEYPHSVILEVWCIDDDDERGWMCGASIINQQFTLTAAHCLEGCSRFSSVSLTVGHANKLKGAVSSAYGIKYHNAFNSQTFRADIGLVRLKTPLKLGPNIQRVILMRNPPNAQVAYVAGWGDTRENGEGSKWLRHAMQPVWSLRECRKVMGRLQDDAICAGPKSGKPYATAGDSGAALVIEDHIQIGVFSYRKPSITPSIGVYINVSHYINWIVSSTAAMTCGK